MEAEKLQEKLFKEAVIWIYLDFLYSNDMIVNKLIATITTFEHKRGREPHQHGFKTAKDA